MAKERIDTSKQPAVTVAHCEGDLVVRAWLEPAIQVKGDYEVKADEEDSWALISNSDLRLLVPENSNITVKSVTGDLLMKGIKGAITIDNVKGDAVLTNLNHLKISEIAGDLVARNLDGPLQVERVLGDVVARNIADQVAFETIYGDVSGQFINGPLRINEARGDINAQTVNNGVTIEHGLRDVNLRNIGGTCLIADVLGDIRLKGGLNSGEHIFAARGDIIVRWPEAAPLTIMAKGSRILNRLTFDDIQENENSLSGRIGDGDVVVSLTAGGRIILKEARLLEEKWETDPQEDFDMDFTIDFDRLGERISKEVNQHMARFAAEIESQVDPDFAYKISDKMSRQAEKAARKAEAAAERAREYAEREVNRVQQAQRRAQRDPVPQAKESATSKKASKEEQLKILRMVEKGTITPDEANTLLKALEE